MNSKWNDFITGIQPGSINDKIIGSIYGHALGDAVGVPMKFKSKGAEFDSFPYSKQVRGFPICDWSEATDHMILVMHSMIANKFEFYPCDMAKRLRTWTETGFKDLGDTKGHGSGGPTIAVIDGGKFLEDPFLSAKELWESSGKKMSTNGSLSRTSILGTISDSKQAEIIAANLSQITHVDMRCIVSCVVQTLIIHGLIYGSITNVSNIDDIMDWIAVVASRNTSEDMFKELNDWVTLSFTSSLSDLQLSDMAARRYVFKCLGCSVYALHVMRVSLENNRVPSFRKFITRIVSEGGDSDTNAAVAGATMGAYLGYHGLPLDWIESLPNHNWLNTIIMDYISALPGSVIDDGYSPI